MIPVFVWEPCNRIAHSYGYAVTRRISFLRLTLFHCVGANDITKQARGYRYRDHGCYEQELKLSGFP